MTTFIFEDYTYDNDVKTATFSYRYADGRRFVERLAFERTATYNDQVLDRALFLAFIVIGVSYIKTFLANEIIFEKGGIDEWQANFLNRVYQEGLGQYAYENNLTRDDLPHFAPTGTAVLAASEYEGAGAILLQSGGKDSLLLAQLFEDAGRDFTPLYIRSGESHPAVLDQLVAPLVTIRRDLDRQALRLAVEEGARNGHVPVTYIVQAIALVQTVLLGKNTVLAAIAHEGEEPHHHIGDLAVNHQWSKTWPAEQLFAEYVTRYISPELRVGSPLRGDSELKVAELFVERAWSRFGHSFSSCNTANYQQGFDNTQLVWCGHCPKCANSYLLFAPFLPADELKSLFDGRDLFTSEMLTETFKGLLGIDGVPKPFECIGEVDELRLAYHQAQQKGDYQPLPFHVPASDFQKDATYPMLDWAKIDV